MPPPPAPPPPPPPTLSLYPPPLPSIQLKRPVTAQTSISDKYSLKTKDTKRESARRNSLGNRLAHGTITAPTTPDSAALVEQARLEKVERELHRLKKIIASLLPNELNEDDLRSVYGDLEQPALASGDLIARLVKSRLGTQLSNGYSIQPQHPQANGQTYPPSPHSSSSIQALNAPVLSANSAEARFERPLVHSSTVRRLRAELRPVGHRSKPRTVAPSVTAASQPPPPHKDPNVMAKLLEEMKHHKLRSVKKPKDMRNAH
ncbi:hypothetical protein GGI12_002999 [Dipsacomyces acuminosporus]|nr:hypothetical protein GGI12_002999 [Dipsacomyces acuminosporus]